MTPEALKILNKFQKTELTAQKVELALIDDVNEKLNTGNKLYDASLKSIREINSGILNNCIRNYTESIKLADEVINKAKELGLEAKGIIESKNIAVKNLKESENIKNKLSNI
jgi:hypothetical protein